MEHISTRLGNIATQLQVARQSTASCAAVLITNSGKKDADPQVPEVREAFAVFANQEISNMDAAATRHRPILLLALTSHVSISPSTAPQIPDKIYISFA